MQRIKADKDLALAALPVALIVFVGAALRAAQLDQSLIGDEMWSYVAVTKPDFGSMLDYVRSDEEITPPLFTTLSWLAGKVSYSFDVLRLPSLLAGILTIPIVYGIGMRTLGRRVALTAAALTALSPFLAWYSIELRAYSLVTMLAAASTLLLLTALKRGTLAWWAGYAALSCAAMYTHYTAAYVLAAQLAWVVTFHPGARKAAILANVAAAVAYLPWLGGLRDDLQSPSQDIFAKLAPFNWDNFSSFTIRLPFGNPGLDLTGFLGKGAVAVLIAGFAIALGGWAVRRFGPSREDRGTGPDRERREAVILLAMIGLAAPLGIAFVSLVGPDQFLPRNLTVSSPGILLSFAALLCAGTLATRIASTTLVVGVFAFGAAKNLDPEFQRTAYEDGAAYIDATAEDEDVVLDIAGTSAGGVDGEQLIPPAFALDINFDRPHKAVDALATEDIARARDLAQGARLYLVGLPGFVDLAVEFLGLEDQQPAEDRTFEGGDPLQVRAYDIPLEGGAPAP